MLMIKEFFVMKHEFAQLRGKKDNKENTGKKLKIIISRGDIMKKN